MSGEPVSVPAPCPLNPDRPWQPLGRGSAPALADLAAGRWVLLKQYPDRAAYRVDDSAASYFVKHYRPTGLRGRWKDFVLRRRPQRAYALGVELAGGGVGTPQPLGLFGWGAPLLREAVLVTRWIPECEKWSQHLRGRVTKREAPEHFLHQLEDLAHLLGELHRRRLYHGDLVANLLFGRVSGQWRALVVDLEAVRGHAGATRFHKNLWELARAARPIPDLSARDHWRFLAAYADRVGMGRGEARALWRNLSAAQERRMERRRRA